MGSFGSLIFVIFFVVMTIVQSVASSQQKKADKARKQRLAAQKRAAQQGGVDSSKPPVETKLGPGQTTAASQMQRPSTGPAPTPAGPVDLAARRAQQLQELRQRRATRQQSAQTTANQPKPKRRQGVQNIGRSKPFNQGAKKPQQPQVSIQQREAAARSQARLRAAAEAAREAERTQAIARRHKAVEDADPSSGDVISHGRRGSLEVAPAVTSARAQLAARRGNSVRKALSSRTTMQDLFILKEILDSPVSMRPPAGTS